MNSTVLGRRLYADNYGLDITNNELALIYAIISAEPIKADQAMDKFGVRPLQKDDAYKNKPVNTIGQAAFILTRICGLMNKEASIILDVKQDTIRFAMHRIGYYGDGRSRKGQFKTEI